MSACKINFYKNSSELLDKYVLIDKEKCIACGKCEELCGEIFEIDQEKDGKSYSTLDCNLGVSKIPKQLFDGCLKASEECPSQCILIQDTPFREKNEY